MTNHLYTVIGRASPDLPLRVLNLFAQQDLAFERVIIAREADQYVITININNIISDKARIIAEKMQTIVLVDSVEIKEQ